MGATERARSTGWSASSAPRSRSSTTPSAPGCTPRPGCSAARPASTPPTSAPPTCPGPRCSTASSGTSGCRESPRPRCWRSSARPSTPTGTTPASSPTTRIAIGTGSTTRWPRPRADAPTTESRSRCPGWRSAPSLTSRRCWTRSTVERDVHDRHRNLVVAATGTGQDGHRRPGLPATVRSRPADRPSLLFVAHRQEILEQSLRTYREVLGDANFGELYVGGARPERWRPRLRQRPVADRRTASRTSACRRVRRRRHRRVPPRRGRDLPAAPRPPRTARAARPDRDARARRRRRRPRASSTAGPPPSCGCGTRSAPTCSARSTTSAIADGTDLRSISWTPRPLRRAPSCPNCLHRQRRSRARSSSSSCATRCSTPARCARWASASASRTPSTWPDASARRASPRARSAARHSPTERERALARPARPAGQRPVRRRPVQRGPRHPRRRHRAVPAADRERDRLPAAARPRTAPHPRQGGAHRPRLRRAPPQGVPVRLSSGP